jgi:hypothetical protein
MPFHPLIALLFSLLVLPGIAPLIQDSVELKVVDDFESERVGEPPSKWMFLDFKKQEFLPLSGRNNDQEKLYVGQEGSNQFLRIYTHDASQRITVPAAEIDWDLTTYPRLSWKWRANRLPAGAREDKVNDSGGAVYVSFDKKDWLGRPYSIKYVYSTQLPVGTVVSHGNVKVIVASSGVDGTGSWKTITRNVIEDYRLVFRGDPPQTPFSITLWSDSDNTSSYAEVDFDDIALQQ